MTQTRTYPNVTVKLIGEAANPYVLIGEVEAVLRREVGHQAADEFVVQALNSGSYDSLLAFIQNTVLVV
jgi:hypothetical protein